MNDTPDCNTEYDPFSHESMTDPTDAYRKMREEGCPHWIENRKAWALTLHDDLLAASFNNAGLDFTHGQTPTQLMLGEPVPSTFMTMNVPEHKKWRALLEPYYNFKGVEEQIPRLVQLTRDMINPLVGSERFDVYNDYANLVMCINAGHNLGIDRAEAIHCRNLIDDMMLNREPGQVGSTSKINQKAAMELGKLLHAHVLSVMATPSRGGLHGRVLVEAEVDGRRLTELELVDYFFSLLIVGSETTPLATAGTFYYLAENAEQKAAVLNDLSLADAAFLETCRYDQPTNMLARRARMDFDIAGKTIRDGDTLLFIYASATRDETKFERANAYDALRERRMDLAFGTGAHFCLGARLAQTIGPMMIREALSHMHDFEVDRAACERAYGEHLRGFVKMPIFPVWR